MAEIKSLSHTHVAIMDFLMANPVMHLGDVAKHFGYTQPWLSQIIHSDAFQVMLQEKQGIAFHHTIMPLKDKIIATAHLALDKAMALIPTETDLRTAHQVAGDMLDKLGYGAKPVGPGGNVNITQNNMILPSANAAEIAAAREMLAARKSALGVQVDGVSVPLALPRTSAAEMGENVIQGNISPTDGKNPEREGRAEV